MRKLIITIWIICLGLSVLAQGQPKLDSKLIGVEQSGWDMDEKYALLDQSGYQVGVYSLVKTPDHKYRYLVEYDGKTINIEALSSIAIAPDANRLITWGHDLRDHVGFKLSYRIYDLNGTIIAGKHLACSGPAEGIISNKGELIFLGQKEDNTADSNLYLHKVDMNGQLLWTKDMGQSYPQDLMVSRFDGDIAVLIYDVNIEESFLSVFNSSGKRICRKYQGPFTSMDFVKPDHLAVSGGRQWTLFSYSNDGFQSKLTGRLFTSVSSLHPFVVMEDKFIGIAHQMMEYSEEGFRIDIYEIETGQFVHTILVSEKKFRMAHYRCLLYEDGELTARLGDLNARYSITINK